MRAKTKIMSEIEEVHEQMKVDMKAMKEQRITMMEAMMAIRKIMKVNIVAVVATSTATKRDTTHLPIFKQGSHPVIDVEGQGGAMGVASYGPQYTQSHNRSIFPPYGLAPVSRHLRLTFV